ncbi:MAG: hypothetical protein ACETWK_07395 [Candidatus Aminicenantaceae bacterium]
MGKRICHLEKKIIDSLKREGLTQEIRNHLAVCPDCEETAAVYLWMNRFKDVGMRDNISLKKLPEAESIWRSAHAHPRREKELLKKALKPIVISRITSYVVFVIGVIFLLFSNFQEIKNYAVTNIGASKIFSSLLKTTVQLLPFFLIPMAIIIFWMLFMAIVTAWEKSRA